MAHILPDTPPLSLPSEVLKTFRALKTLPDSYYIWHHLAPWQTNTPDFLMVTHDGRVLLVKVSSAPATQAASAAQLLLIEDNQPVLGAAEADALSSFRSTLNIPENESLETLIVFPNISQKQVLQSQRQYTDYRIQWAGRELLQPDSDLKWEDYLPKNVMESAWVEKIRQRFSPEVVVPAEMTVRPTISRRLEADLTDYLLDYNQEKAVKADLDIDLNGQSLSDDFRVNIINGVAGSGKTLILLYRLRLLHGMYPNKKFLVLTHNRPLNHDMQGRFARLVGSLPDSIEWRTFSGWCYTHWPKNIPWVAPVSISQRENIIRNVWHHALRDTAITERMLLSETDWFKDQIPMSQTEYLQADRRGRGFRLSAEQRQQMYDAIQAYQMELTRLGTLDWGDVPQKMWGLVQNEKVTLPKYDFILIDEAQFFAPLWMALIQKALNPSNAHLFLVADPTQGFLGRGNSWKSLGVEARGHYYQLRRSYRTTREIMQFATLFYRLRLSEERDDEILAPDMLHMPSGAFPQIITLESAQDEITRVANEVAAFIQQGYPRQHLLLLHANGYGVKTLIQAITQRLGKSAAIDPKETYPGDYIRVTTLNAGAGLESPIVFLVGMRELFEEEQSLRLADEEREAIIKNNTRKIFMAATRAGQRLVFTYVGDLPELLKKIFASQEIKG